MIAHSIFPAQCILAESPYWHVGKKSYFWVDIEKGTLYQYSKGDSKPKTWQFEHRLSLVVEGEDDKVILGLDRKIARFDLVTQSLEWIVEVESDLILNRFNDGKCDAKGRLWAGTLSTQFTAGSGSLYLIDAPDSALKKIPNVSISNGIAWTPDQQTMYFIDSPTQEIRAFEFDLEHGVLGQNQVVIQVPKSLGTPDGMTIDQDGNLWIGHYGGFGVYCWDPRTGKLLDKIEVPAPHVTSCTFGGELLDELLITTAQENMSIEDLRKYPASGDIFLAKTDARGFAPNRCKI
jgi:sugar lactone lactonase YvrE